MNKLSELGHCFAYRAELLKAGAELLEVEQDALGRTLDAMMSANDLISEAGETQKLPENRINASIFLD